MKRKTTKRVAKKKRRRKATVAKRRTARPKRRAARTSRRVKRKVSPKRPGGARRRQKRTAKPARAAGARRTKPKAAKRTTTAASKRAEAAKPATTRLARATPLAAPVAPLPPPQPGSVEALVPLVEDELSRRGEDPPDPEVVSALATAGSGYRKGPGADPPFGIPVDIDERVAEGFVEYYWIGDRSPGPDRKAERETDARQWIRFNLEQLGPADATPTAIATLAAVALGVWQPNEDLLAQLKIYADAVAGWYRARLS